jgi:hypothetical protein
MGARIYTVVGLHSGSWHPVRASNRNNVRGPNQRVNLVIAPRGGVDSANAISYIYHTALLFLTKGGLKLMKYGPLSGFVPLLMIFQAFLAFGQEADTVDFVSSNLPVVIIDTHGQTIPDEPKITADMGIIYNGPGQRNAVTDSCNVYNGKIGIEVRGFSSQQFPKLQYAVETRDTLGADLAVSLLGMPAEADWVLSAGYSDKSLLRNALAYQLANSAGRYASRSRFCELILNGEYMGIYVLFEKIKRDKGRVNITKLKNTDVSGDNLTGGYIVKIDRINDSSDQWWASPYPTVPGARYALKYLYVYPKPEDLVEVQKTYIQDFVTAFETSMLDSNFADTTTGYVRYLDRASAVDYFLFNEMARNVDAYRASFYMYKDRDSKGGKLVLGPVWDFDIAFGNVDYGFGADTAGWDLIELPPVLAEDKEEDQVPFWWNRLATDSTFWYEAGDRWASLRKTVFAPEAVYAFIDSVALYIDEGQARNFQRWPILSTYVWPNAYIGGTYANEIAYVKDWLAHRMTWMDNALPPPRVPVPRPDDTLRVTFNAFSAAAADTVVTLHWETARERNTTQFEIQRRSADSLAQDTTWMTIGTVPAADTSSNILVYAFRDTLHTSANLFYRLKLDGKNSQYVLSPVVNVRVAHPSDSLVCELKSFTADENQGYVHLQWETLRELNTRLFEVQRKLIDTLAQDLPWVTLDSVQAAGTSTSSRTYAYTDSTQTIRQAIYRLRTSGGGSQFQYSTEILVRLVAIATGKTSLPSHFALQQNYPNPFNPATVVGYQLPVAGRVRIMIYDLLGRVVVTLLDEFKNPGTYVVRFDGAKLASGPYICRMTAGDFIASRVMLLMK